MQLFNLKTGKVNKKHIFVVEMIALVHISTVLLYMIYQDISMFFCFFITKVIKEDMDLRCIPTSMARVFHLCYLPPKLGHILQQKIS